MTERRWELSFLWRWQHPPSGYIHPDWKWKMWWNSSNVSTKVINTPRMSFINSLLSQIKYTIELWGLLLISLNMLSYAVKTRKNFTPSWPIPLSQCPRGPWTVVGLYRKRPACRSEAHRVQCFQLNTWQQQALVNWPAASDPHMPSPLSCHPDKRTEMHRNKDHEYKIWTEI